jgi:hypothetical protein
MDIDAKPRTSFVVGPDGFVLTHANLPSRNTQRWVARRKAEVVAAVRGGLLSLTDACERYSISGEEFFNWDLGFERQGLSGLRALSVPKRSCAAQQLTEHKSRTFPTAS